MKTFSANVCGDVCIEHVKKQVVAGGDKEKDFCSKILPLVHYQKVAFYDYF